MICQYGCGQEATHQFKNGKWCCSYNPMKCPNLREKFKGEKIFLKGKIPWNKGKRGVYSEETISKIRIGNTGKKLSEDTLKKLRGRISWNKGKKGTPMSTEQKQYRRKLMLNGLSLKMIKCIKKISNEELKLRDMVKQLYPESEFQYPVFRYSLDIAIPDKKIAIEYDGYYHFNTEEHKQYHKFRQEKIEKEGWKFLKYTMFDTFPTIDQVKQDINMLRNKK